MKKENKKAIMKAISAATSMHANFSALAKILAYKGQHDERIELSNYIQRMYIAKSKATREEWYYKIITTFHSASAILHNGKHFYKCMVTDIDMDDLKGYLRERAKELLSDKVSPSSWAGQVRAATLTNGEAYTGYFSRGKYDGKGILRYANGDVYTGSFANGKPEGIGILDYANGDYYRGYYKDGKRHGNGLFRLGNLEVYKGEWKKGRKNGMGELKKINGVSYDGYWKNDIKQGKGIYKWADGIVYDGEFVNDIALTELETVVKSNGGNEWKNIEVMRTKNLTIFPKITIFKN